MKILMKIILFQLLLLFLLFNFSCKSPSLFIDPDKSHASNVAKSFKAIPQNPVVFRIQQDTFIAPKGGHLQGIQQLDKQHLVISGSSDEKAYFFIARMKGITRVKKRGLITNMIYINDDFPEMRHNHASGFQLFDNLLVIGTEGGPDTVKSSIVFYDLTYPDSPRPLPFKINRQEDTAGAIGLICIGDKIILAVGGWDSNRIDFYEATKAPFSAMPLTFSLIKTWHTENKNTIGWTNTSWGSYQSLNFVKDEGDNLFLTGFYQNGNDVMIADLYEVHLENDATTLLKKIDTKRLLTIEGVSFKNGAGLSILNAPKQLNLLATERNWNALIRVNYW